MNTSVYNNKNNHKKCEENITMEKIIKNETRIPIVTIIGHVDHGKTTLLNYIKNIKKPTFEHGGITQNIKAYCIDTKYGHMTFLDTPGHVAFNSLRVRGIQCTDIVILVIAADDGIMPQTIEGITIAQKFNIPIIVAINKIDKITSNNRKITNELSKYNLIPETWGGETLFTSVSAKTGEGIDTLLESINLQSEILNLKNYKDKKAEGIVIDSNIDLGKGYITSILILNGSLKKGDIIISKNKWGKIKSIINDKNKNITNACTSTPVNITGINIKLEAGEKFTIVETEKQVKNIIANYKEKPIVSKKIYSINELLNNLKKDKEEKVNLILKTNLLGSIDVLEETIKKLSDKKIIINIVKSDIGNFNKSDIDLAIATKSDLIGFNIKLDSKIKKIAKNEKIKINCFNIIYEIIDYIKDIISTRVPLEDNDTPIGIAEIKKLFKHDNTKIISGCIVLSGKIKQNSVAKIYRNNKLIHTSIIESIKVFKSDVLEVKCNMECGIGIKNYNDFKINDKIKTYIN